jgi:hypothetical protein
MIDDGDPRIIGISFIVLPNGSVRMLFLRRTEDLTLGILVIFSVERATDSILGRDEPHFAVSCGEHQLVVLWHSLFKVKSEGHVCR